MGGGRGGEFGTPSDLLQYDTDVGTSSGGKGQFAAMPGWWRDHRKGYKINGGFFKYYPHDCKYIYDKFMDDINKWQQYYYETFRS